ncbi:PfkB family carbohydrate kinase, partial [Lysobacter sp. D1-1-M9]|uniref:PfkB family carbohydrate kinase n=1 Tax=Novilysobacter longmucuonensis TaxID=3098603 RepID=UPI002FC8D468
DAVVAGFTAANAAGALAMLNPAPADALVPASLLARGDLITPNESEFCAQLARHCGEHLEADGLAGLDDDRLHALCRRLLPHGTVVITLGAAGCFASHADPGRHGDDQPFRRVPAFPAQAVDTTGAGDAFSGALAASIAAGGARFSDHLEF